MRSRLSYHKSHKVQGKKKSNLILATKTDKRKNIHTMKTDSLHDIKEKTNEPQIINSLKKIILNENFKFNLSFKDKLKKIIEKN